MEKSIEAKKKPPVPRFDPAEPQKQQTVTQERRLSFKARR